MGCDHNNIFSQQNEMRLHKANTVLDTLNTRFLDQIHLNPGWLMNMITFVVISKGSCQLQSSIKHRKSVMSNMHSH